MLTFTTQKNGIREGGSDTRRPETLYCDPRLPYSDGCPTWDPTGCHLHSTIWHHDSGGEVEKCNPRHDLKDPQDLRRLLRTEPRIWSQGLLHLLPWCLWCHGPPLLRSKQRHHQADWPMAQKHVQVETLTRKFLRLMLMHGNYSFIPHQEEVTCL